MTKPIRFDHKDCGTCPIRYQAVCSRCEPAELSVLEAAKYYRTFSAGQPIVWSGDRLDFVGSVITGVAMLSQGMEDGRTQMVGLLMPSDFLGRPGRERAPYDVTAVTDVTFCCFRRNQFEGFLDKTPHIGQRLLQMTLDELDAAREWLLILGRKTAREKICSFLVSIAEKDAKLHLTQADDGIGFDLPLTRTQMADYLGLTLETVSRQISALKNEGVIVLLESRRVQVPDFQALKDGAGLAV
jgi:CRP/FNR family transcriptional regulator, anaerobic regulatory protein